MYKPTTFTACTHLAILLIMASCAAQAAEVTLRGQVQLTTSNSAKRHQDSSDVIVWLTPVQGLSPASLVAPRLHDHLRLTQKDKKFDPHILVVPVGSMVEFPNHDPFFHSVFSLFEGKRFDLGLYEAGSSRRVHFDRPGISYIFCNIHPQMSAVVISLQTPYYGISVASGAFTISGVPPGTYQMQLWYEGSTPDVLKRLSRQVTISEKTTSLAAIHLPQNAALMPHKNKYGHNYDLSGNDPLYQQQQP